ncbi:DNA-3-methyladenine glycosylase I [Microlunatus endophyticus]|uniref:DNA-3-methyladenine glycosylase I n=1 Tax=Microlunatus endophyticus TaxID=1716077 RepID=A0A917W0U3_9ACTN|nr:DNA-3-methyladenine glycosylase I [Microlunatus endophyticus]GGL47465.1 DNA-3-methyladenine glycosylase I [Microlunatus endophyticus]
MPEAHSGSVVGPDGRRRCPWGTGDPVYLDYHDTEWGRPVSSVQGLYERLTLEAFQSGLSWITILRKRPAFRAAFAGFVPEQVAAFTDHDVVRLMADAGIVRNRAKIEAAISNARVVADWGQGFAELVLSYAEPDRPRPAHVSAIPAVTPESFALSKALKKHGIRFFGPTTAYASMQAVGLVDDHLVDCFVTL